MTAATQLTLLQQALAATFTASKFLIYTSPGSTGSGDAASTPTIQNQMVQALNKIVWNTYATAINTGNATAASHDKMVSGTYAQGGWITGGIPGRDSVHILAMQDEFMVNSHATRALTQKFGSGVMDMINMGRVPTMIENSFSPPPSAPITNVVNFPRGGGGNSNAELLAKIDKLTEEVKKLREENTKVTIGTSNQQTRAIGQIGEDIGEGIDKGARRIADQSRMNAQMQKQRGR
jgi:hypothetical protein